MLSCLSQVGQFLPMVISFSNVTLWHYVTRKVGNSHSNCWHPLFSSPWAAICFQVIIGNALQSMKQGFFVTSCLTMVFIMVSPLLREPILVLIHFCWNMYLMIENLKEEDFWSKLLVWELFDPFSISLFLDRLEIKLSTFGSFLGRHPHKGIVWWSIFPMFNCIHVGKSRLFWFLTRWKNKTFQFWGE